MEKLKYEEIETLPYVTNGDESLHIDVNLLNKIIESRKTDIFENLIDLVKGESTPLTIQRVKEILNEQ